MARQPTQAEVFNDLLARYEKEVAEAFRRAIDDIGSNVDLTRVIEALARNDIQAAMEALNIEPAAYNDLLDTISRAYSEAGTTTANIANRQTPRDVVIRFDGRNYRAEAWLREHSSQLVTRIITDQRSAVRSALEAGMARGDNPRTTALDIVGRVNKATRKREGGVIGLTGPQEGFVRSAREELRSGDPALLRKYLTRARRDRRFDRSVEKAIREETPLPLEIAGKAELQYRNRLLALRGETIGRVETMTAIQQAKWEAYRQAIEAGRIREEDVRKVWRSAGDLRVRHTHRALNGDSVGFRETFKSPSGARLLFPMDTSNGAGADETINCRCGTDYRVDYLANLR